MLLKPCSNLDLHYLNAPGRKFCAKPLLVGTMQFTPLMFCCCWSASKIVNVSAADYSPPHTAISPRQTGLEGGGWEDAASV